MPYKVLKPIPNGDGTYFQAGEIVAADGWRNLRQLVNGRYLAEVLEVPAAQDDAEEPAEAESPAPRKKRARTTAPDGE